MIDMANSVLNYYNSTIDRNPHEMSSLYDRLIIHAIARFTTSYTPCLYFLELVASPDGALPDLECDVLSLTDSAVVILRLKFAVELLLPTGVTSFQTGTLS